mmetsp:Transcript_35368/g.117202  ORF Transcript_35368/g.117202 Transcript_35368/m.117202 type:complete len:243 (+) Transcript_35368:1069-1797(+)
MQPVESEAATSSPDEERLSAHSWPPRCAAPVATSDGAVIPPRGSSRCRPPAGEATRSEDAEPRQRSAAAPGAKKSCAPGRDSWRRSAVRRFESKTYSSWPSGPSCARRALAASELSCTSRSWMTPRGKSGAAPTAFTPERTSKTRARPSPPPRTSSPDRRSHRATVGTISSGSCTVSCAVERSISAKLGPLPSVPSAVPAPQRATAGVRPLAHITPAERTPSDSCRTSASSTPPREIKCAAA